MSSSSSRDVNRSNRNSRVSASASRAAQDEAYAQALQEEYRKDFLRRQAKKNKYAQERREREQQQRELTQSGGIANTAAHVAASATPLAPLASAPPEDFLSSPYVPPASAVAPPPLSSISSPFALNRSQTVEDERYARQLQAELEREETQVSHQRNNINNTRSSNGNRHGYRNAAAATTSLSAPPLVPTSAEPYINSGNVFAPDDQDPSYLDLKLAQELQDEEYARRLQKQNSASVSVSATAGVPAVVALPQRSHSNFSDERTSSNVSDQAVARRIQQELQDAEYAQRLSVREQQEAMDAAVALQQQTNATPRRRSGARLIPLFLCGTTIAVVILLFVLGVFETSDIPFLGDAFGDDFVGSDPWSGNTTGAGGPQVGVNTFAWANSGNGLTLEILNACSDDWQVYLTEAVNNWDNGSPIDSLSFTVTRIEYESQCSDVQGKLKVCNGNYGDTRWRGLNEVLLSPRQNTIISSTARLNEYYLAREDDAQKLYTVCHELGHGFGLPHWDEDFFNKDLGNCMDYTQNPSRNSKPDQSNFLFLAELYGGRNVTATSAIEDAVPPGNNRHLRRGQGEQEHTSRLMDVLPYNPHRRILHTNEDHEVHIIPSQEHEGCWILQQYLLVVP